jgi:hypothetical protein
MKIIINNDNKPTNALASSFKSLIKENLAKVHVMPPIPNDIIGLIDSNQQQWSAYATFKAKAKYDKQTERL